MEKIYFKNKNRIDYYNISYHYNLENKTNIQQLLNIDCVDKPNYEYVEVGPHNFFKTAFCSNVINILKRIGVDNVEKFEHIKLYDINSNYKIDSMLECDMNIKVTNNNEFYPEYTDITDVDTLDKYGLSFDIDELALYTDLYSKLERRPYFIELFDLCQSNSEHSRHWFFKGKLIVKNENFYLKEKQTLFDLVKSTLNKKNSNSIVSFSDNSSVIQGFNVKKSISNIENYNIQYYSKNLDIVCTAETHNFPTLICPFQGASTGVGGRIRDNHATGKGAYILASLAGYCVGQVDFNNFDEKYGYNSPLNILINASNGASDYGNKIGEPIIGGFTRSFGLNLNDEKIEYIKPIMFSAGLGCINKTHNFKNEPKRNNVIVRIGGPAYKIGLGGGFSSSIDNDQSRKHLDLSAVQRGDPQMGNKLNRVIQTLIDLDEFNPIISIHDQGAGGLANVVKEIIYPNGAEIYLDNVTCGDSSLEPLEIWCSEFQESSVILIDNQNISILEKICNRENVIFDKIGYINDSKKIIVNYNGNIIMDLPLQPVLEPEIQKTYILEEKNIDFKEYELPDNLDFDTVLKNVLSCIDVGSKRFLTNKVDRSVTGLIVQQQCVGPFHTPISNYSLISLSYFDIKGIASAIGEKPYLGITSPISQGSMTVGEMVTNMMGCYIENLSNIKCSANWMWPLKCKGESFKLYQTALSMCNTLKELNIGIDGGKDSLSMSVKYKDEIIKSPGNLVLTGYSSCPDISKHITPNFKSDNSTLIHIDLSIGKMRMGNSIFLKHFNQIGASTPNLENTKKLKDCFNYIQSCIKNNYILSLHDISDGGLITTLCEMSISSNIGVDIKINDFKYYEYLFNEELGIVIEIQNNIHIVNKILNDLSSLKISRKIIGHTNNNKLFSIKNFNENIYNTTINILSEYWEAPSYECEKFQTQKECVTSEYANYKKLIEPKYNLNCELYNFCVSDYRKIESDTYPKICILRDEGSNGDKEMCAVFNKVGFDVYDIHMNDILKNPKLINKFRGIAYVGGFSHGDSLGAAEGWHLSIKNNEMLQLEFQLFMNRTDTFSLGVCNGCQLMVKQNLFDSNLKLVENNSNRFESRFSNVKIINTNNIFFKNMQDMSFGIWVAHGEGKFINTKALNNNQKVLAYTHNNNNTEIYPHNPNGSEDGLAGVCSDNGRHLAMMPHPERSFLKWQLPYCGKYNIHNSPWLYMFNNIFEWAINN